MVNASQNATNATAPVMALNTAKNSATGKPQNGIPGVPDAPGAGGKAAAKGGVDESQDRFLKLLVTQMKNQDPLNPMDNAQVTSQMAQLSTVSGIDKLNSTLKALSNSMTSSHSVQAAAMIGHVVLAPGNKMELKGGKAAAALDLEQPADSINVQIKDATGNVVRSLILEGKPGGVLPIHWDGKDDANETAREGDYQFSATASLAGVKSSVKALSYGLVSGVIQKPEGSSLNVERLGEVSMDAVKQIL